MPVNHCQSIRDDIANHEQEILSLQEVLNEVPVLLRRTFEATIKREKEHLARLKRALKACELGR